MNTLKIYSRLWLLAFLIVGFFTYGFGRFYNVTTLDILNLEFADSYIAFKSYLTMTLNSGMTVEDHWTPATYFDFGYLVSYTLLFMLSLKVFQHTLQAKIPMWCYLLCFVPGLFDVVENILMLRYFADLNAYHNASFSWYQWMVRLKWASVIPFIIAALTIILFYLSKIFGFVANIVLGLLAKKA